MTARAQLPSGALTMLFTDIEGSTRLLHELGGEYTVLLAEHHRLVRAAFTSHGGLEVRTPGDSFFVVFEQPAAASAAACEIQEALAAHAWPRGVELRVRIGLHHGEALLSDGDYVGIDVHRAARIAAAAHGGQVLLSAETAVLLGPDFRTRDLGPHALKDLPEPERLVQLLVPGLSQSFPPPRAHVPPPEAAGLPDYSLPPADVPNPYKGLAPFTVDDAALFCGREELVEALAAKLDAFPFVAVVGPSGTGKSSLVRAGLLATGIDVRFVDQFEEVFTLRGEAERTRLLDELLDSVYRERGRPVVIALRADFYGHCAAYPRLAAALQDHQVLVGPMSEDGLRRAIEEPARRAGLVLEPGLAETILRDVSGQPGALPLLSHALFETWKRRSGRLLTLLGYLQSGGIREAIARTAESAYAGFTTEQQEIARRTFLRLVALGEGTEDTRRRVDHAELDERARDVVAALVEARILTADERTVEVAHEALIRHWPRLRGWLDADREGLRIHRRLTEAAREWAALGRDPDALYRGARLAAAGEWATGREDELNALEREFLQRSREHERGALEAARRRNRRLRALAGALGVLVLGAGGLAAVAVRQTERAREQGRASLSRALAGQSLTLLERRLDQALLVALEGYRQERTPEARSALAAAIQRTRGFRAILAGAHERVTALAVSPDGRLLATGGPDGRIAFWDLDADRGAGRSVRAATGVRGLAFSPDGRTVAAATAGGQIALFDVMARRPAASLEEHLVGVDAVAFDPAGGRLASISGFEGRALRWDVARRRAAGPDVRFGSVTGGVLALSADGRVAAVEERSGRVRVLDLRSGRSRSVVVAGRRPTALGLDRDGRLLATGDRRGRIVTWDTRTGRPASAPVARHRTAVRAVALLPGGRVVSAAANGEVAEGPAAAAGTVAVAGHAAAPTAIVAARSGFVTGGVDGAAIAWPLDAGGALEQPTRIAPGGVGMGLAPGGATAALAYPFRVEVRSVPDARVVATIARRGYTVTGADVLPGDGAVAVADITARVYLWEFRGRIRRTTRLRSYQEDFGGVTTDPSGRRALAWGDDGSVTIWALRGGRTLGVPQRAHERGVSDAVFSADGSLVATAGADRLVRTFDARDLRPVARLGGHSARSTAVAFSPDGRILASGGADGTVRLWDVRGRRSGGAPFDTGAAEITDLAFSPDGDVLAVLDGRGVAFWHVPSRTLLGRRLPAPGGARHGDFGAGGRLVSVGDRTMRVWEPALWSGDLRRAAARVCALVGRSLTREEFARFLPGEDHRPGCPAAATR